MLVHLQFGKNGVVEWIFLLKKKEQSLPFFTSSIFLLDLAGASDIIKQDLVQKAMNCFTRILHDPPPSL